MYQGIRYLNCVFEMFLLYYFLESLFPVYQKKSARVCGILLFAGMIYGVNQIGIPALNLLTVLLCYLGFTWFVFRINIPSALPYILLCLGLLSLTEFIFHYIYRLFGIPYWKPGTERLCLSLVQGVLRFVVIEILRKNSSSVWGREPVVRGYLNYLFLLPVSTIILLNGVIYVGYDPLGYLLICLGGVLLLLSNAGSFFIIEHVLKVLEGKREAEQRLLKAGLEQKHYQKLEEVNQEYARYAHEVKKAVRVIGQLVEQEDKREISQILCQLQEKGRSFSQRLYCADTIINAILLDRQRIADETGVIFEANLQPGIDFSFIREMDRITLFGNLIDNALQAAGKTEKGYVRIHIYRGNRAMLIVRVENNFRIPPVKRGSDYLTIKKEPGHGYGLKNVREMAESYGGSLYTTVKENTFSAVLALSSVQKTES